MGIFLPAKTCRNPPTMQIDIRRECNEEEKEDVLGLKTRGAREGRWERMAGIRRGTKLKQWACKEGIPFTHMERNLTSKMALRPFYGFATEVK